MTDGPVFLLHPLCFHCSPSLPLSSGCGRESAVLFYSLPLALPHSLSLPFAHSFAPLPVPPCSRSLSLSTLVFFLLFSLALIFHSSLSLIITPSASLTGSSALSLPKSPLSSLVFPSPAGGHEDGYSPASSSSSSQPPRLETSSAHSGLRSFHEHCFQDQRGRETNRGLMRSEKSGGGG